MTSTAKIHHVFSSPEPEHLKQPEHLALRLMQEAQRLENNTCCDAVYGIYTQTDTNSPSAEHVYFEGETHEDELKGLREKRCIFGGFIYLIRHHYDDGDFANLVLLEQTNKEGKLFGFLAKQMMTGPVHMGWWYNLGGVELNMEARGQVLKQFWEMETERGSGLIHHDLITVVPYIS